MIIRPIEAPHIVKADSPKGVVRNVRFVMGVWLTRQALQAGEPPHASEEFICQIPPKSITVQVRDANDEPTGETREVQVDRQAHFRRVVQRWVNRLKDARPAERAAHLERLRTQKFDKRLAREEGDFDDVLASFSLEEVEA